FIVENQAHSALANLSGKLVRRLAHDAPSYSGVGASGKPGAVQLIDHLFSEADYRRLYVEIDAENQASVRLIERLGFVREGYLRQHEVTHKGLCDMLIYGLLRNEWLAMKG
ncbi:GNAT family N-acetyltransferase, partial [Xinfangfangia sp. D13-10-4-6]|uniref:GNAT family N-acetyltransferase n=1 Tax=Pseudogemmobacter hezensis TaxID=2737662 RepID=UPI0015573B24